MVVEGNAESLSLKLGRLQVGNRNHISAIKDNGDELELERRRKLKAQKRALKRDLKKSQVVADFVITPPPE